MAETQNFSASFLADHFGKHKAKKEDKKRKFNSSKRIKIPLQVFLQRELFKQEECRRRVRSFRKEE